MVSGAFVSARRQFSTAIYLVPAVNDLAAGSRVRGVAGVSRRGPRGRGNGVRDPGVDRGERDDRATGSDNRGDLTMAIFTHRASPLGT
jgi:hypothetical protein